MLGSKCWVLLGNQGGRVQAGCAAALRGALASFPPRRAVRRLMGPLGGDGGASGRQKTEKGGLRPEDRACWFSAASAVRVGKARRWREQSVGPRIL